MDLKNKNGIKNDLHLSHIEAKVDFTETINNTYRDVVQPIAQKTGKGVAFCFEFLTNKIKPYMYEKVEEAKYKCKEIDKKLEKKYSKIPDENKTMPRTCIIGPALDVLKYNLDEEHQFLGFHVFFMKPYLFLIHCIFKCFMAFYKQIFFIKFCTFFMALL